VFDPARRPWIRADLADADTVAEAVRRCPTDPIMEPGWRAVNVPLAGAPGVFTPGREGAR
jgi:hypothetical protein